MVEVMLIILVYIVNTQIKICLMKVCELKYKTCNVTLAIEKMIKIKVSWLTFVLFAEIAQR